MPKTIQRMFDHVGHAMPADAQLSGDGVDRLAINNITPQYQTIEILKFAENFTNLKNFFVFLQLGAGGGLDRR